MRVSSSFWSDMKRGYMSIDWTHKPMHEASWEDVIVPWSVASLLATSAREDGCSLHAIDSKYPRICSHW